MSESRQAEIFNRRQTQQRPSTELGEVSDSQTTHLVMGLRRVSTKTAALADSRISGAMGCTAGVVGGCGGSGGLRFNGVSSAYSPL